MKFFRKPYRFAVLYSLFLVLLTVFIMLDTFVIAKGGVKVDDDSFLRRTSQLTTALPVTGDYKDSNYTSEIQTDIISTVDNQTEESPNTADYGFTENSYYDENISVTLETIRYCETTVYIADIKLSNVMYLKAAFANDTYGQNYKEKTSVMAKRNNAIIAINGDYYGFDKYGYVLRNGILYRQTKSNTYYDDLVVWENGDMTALSEDINSAEDLMNQGALHIFSFGPALIKNGALAVSDNEEVGTAMNSNPRTAMGMIEPLHYLFVVSDGRTSDNKGLSLFQLAQLFSDYNCTLAYNLDGGGSSTLYFNGKIINNPTTNGKKISEREVSDIVYIGY